MAVPTMTRAEMESVLFTIWDGCAEGQYRICPLCGAVVGYERYLHIQQHFKATSEAALAPRPEGI